MWSRAFLTSVVVYAMVWKLTPYRELRYLENIPEGARCGWDKRKGVVYVCFDGLVCEKGVCAQNCLDPDLYFEGICDEIADKHPSQKKEETPAKVERPEPSTIDLVCDLFR